MTRGEEYLERLQEQLEARDLTFFIMMAQRTTFKPFEDRDVAKVKRKVKKNPGKYGGKTIAYVTLSIKKKDTYPFVVKVNTFRILEDGTVSDGVGDSWGLRINYTLDDLDTRKFKLKDLHKIINYCGDGLLHNDAFNGSSFPNFIKLLERKGLSLDR